MESVTVQATPANQPGRSVAPGVASPAGGTCAARLPAVLSVPVETERPEAEEAPVAVPESENPWVTVVHNDPVNLMSYVTYVFQTYFGYPKDKAKKLMMDVHHKGRAVVSSGSREEMERDVQAMHGYGLWATLQRDS